MRGRRVNPTGRSAGSVRNKFARYPEDMGWVGRQRDMLESPAFGVLDKAEHQVLARLEIEFSKQGLNSNGDLICTYMDFAACGTDSKRVAKAIRVLEALGFIRKTSGSAGNAGQRVPNKFRLTYLWTKFGAATHEWAKIKTLDEARAIREEAIAARSQRRAPAIHGTKARTAQAS